MALLTVNNLRTEFALSKGFVAAVDDVSFELNEGECLGIVGESGCGKTTTGLSIMQLLPRNGKVAGGEILFDGHDLAKFSDKQMQDIRGNTIALLPSVLWLLMCPHTIHLDIILQVVYYVERYSSASILLFRFHSRQHCVNLF